MIKLPEQFAGLRQRSAPLDEKVGERLAKWAAGEPTPVSTKREPVERTFQAVDVGGDQKPGTLADAIEDTPAEAKVAEIKEALEQADAETVEAVIAEAETHREALGDLMTGLEIAFDQARRRVGAKEVVNG